MYDLQKYGRGTKKKKKKKTGEAFAKALWQRIITN